MKWLALAILLTTSATCSAAPTSHQQRMWRIVLDSNTLYREGMYDEGSTPEQQHAKVRAARRRFAGMKRAHLRGSLHATLLELPNRTVARQSVAYVAALHGFDVEINARRLMTFGENYQHKIWGYKDVSGVAESTYGRFYEIYERYQIPEILKRLLTEKSDGAGATVLTGTRLDLLCNYPNAVFAVMEKDRNALVAVRYSLETEGGEREKRLLRRYRHSQSKFIRQFVWMAQRAMSNVDMRRRQDWLRQHP